jgi:biofilm protein TabA
MILDTIDNAEQYTFLHPLFQPAFEFLATLDARTVTPGIYELRGRDLYVIISQSSGGVPVPPRLEAHKKYIDLQVTLLGSFHVGWRPLAECTRLQTPYDEGKDATVYDDPPELRIRLETGRFAVFFPEDAHAPESSPKELMKAVFKIAR